MINEISSTLQNGQSLVIKMDDLSSAGIAVVSIRGLGPPSAIINSSGGATFDGEIVSASRVGKRVINLTVAIISSAEKEEDVRHLLYKFFPIKKQITFGVKTETRDLTIEGYVEVHNMNMFSPIENSELTLVCPEAYFKGTEEISVAVYGIHPEFEFPFSNESIFNPLIIMGDIKDSATQSIIYQGEVDAGCIITIGVGGLVEGIGIHNVSHNQSMYIDTDIVNTQTGGPVDIGDTIIIDTRVGHKSVILNRGGVTYNILNAVGLFTKWILLYSGINNMAVTADLGLDHLVVDIVYYELHEGV